MEGGIRNKDLNRIITALERSAKAQEDLIQLATEERDSGELLTSDPPFCPHCGMFNPNVTSRGGEGPMVEFALIATCGNCQEEFFSVPQGWTNFKTRDEAKTEIEGRVSK